MKKIPITDPVILAFKKRLLERFSKDIRKVLLYGSRARGDFEQGSDYDVIVLVDKADKTLEEQICNTAWDFGFEHHVSISVLVFEQTLLETDLYEPLFINIRREGVAVWEVIRRDTEESERDIRDAETMIAAIDDYLKNLYQHDFWIWKKPRPLWGFKEDWLACAWLRAYSLRQVPVPAEVALKRMKGLLQIGPRSLGYIAMGRGYIGLKRERHGCSVNGNDQILKAWRWKNDDKTRAGVDRP